MSFTQEDLNEMRWDFIQRVVFLKHEIIVTFCSGRSLTAKSPDNETYLQFFKETKNRLKEDQIEIGDLPDESFGKT